MLRRTDGRMGFAQSNAAPMESESEGQPLFMTPTDWIAKESSLPRRRWRNLCHVAHGKVPLVIGPIIDQLGCKNKNSKKASFVFGRNRDACSCLQDYFSLLMASARWVASSSLLYHVEGKEVD